MQKFATARWLVNGCQSTPTVHSRKGKPSASAKPKVRDNRMNPWDANQCQSSGSLTRLLVRERCRFAALRLCNAGLVRGRSATIAPPLQCKD
jgi:hypothetical protein